MARAYWGKGYMNEALKALISHAFEVMGMRRLFYGLLRREWVSQ